MDFTSIREQVLDTVHKLCAAGLIRMSSGNVSARDASGHVAITPSGLSYEEMAVNDICVVNSAGHLIDGSRKPSTEMPMHLAILDAMPAVNAVVHTHSIYAMAFAAARRPIPVAYVEAALIGEVPVARYAPPGTADDATVALEAFRASPASRAILLANHGVVAIGPNLKSAWETAYQVEIEAQICLLAGHLGGLYTLSESEIAEVRRLYHDKL